MLYVITLKPCIVIFLSVENETFRYLRKTNVNKRCLFLALRTDFFRFFLASATSSLMSLTAKNIKRRVHLGQRLRSRGPSEGLSLRLNHL